MADVIDLAKFRLRQTDTDAHPIFYLSRDGAWLDMLSGFGFLEIEDIRSQLGLRHALLTSRPDLVLVESNLDWIDPIEAIQEISGSLNAPVVLIRHPEAGSDGNLLKRAFAAGLHDSLVAPLCPDELGEALGVLLKMRRCVAD
jgi:AmiR/NasT family two-component response regulator